MHADNDDTTTNNDKNADAAVNFIPSFFFFGKQMSWAKTCQILHAENLLKDLFHSLLFLTKKMSELMVNIFKTYHKAVHRTRPYNHTPHHTQTTVECKLQYPYMRMTWMCKLKEAAWIRLSTPTYFRIIL